MAGTMKPLGGIAEKMSCSLGLNSVDYLVALISTWDVQRILRRPPKIASELFLWRNVFISLR